MKRFHLSNLNFGLQLEKETFEAANVVMRIRKSNRQWCKQKKTKKQKIKHTSNSRKHIIRKTTNWTTMYPYNREKFMCSKMASSWCSTSGLDMWIKMIWANEFLYHLLFYYFIPVHGRYVNWIHECPTVRSKNVIPWWG